MKKTSIFLTLIIILAFALRLYKIDNPIADWHSWRQADTAAVTRNFIKMGFNPFFPRYDDLSNIQTGQDNPMGYRFVEFPIYNAISYFFISLSQGFLTVEVWQRLVSIIASLFSIYFIYKITSYYVSRTAGLVSAFFFAVLPFSVYYSRVILPEPLMVSLSLAALYTFIIWIDKQEKIWLLLLSSILAATAILTKPFAIFFFPPMVYLAFTGVKLNRNNLLRLGFFGLLALAPFVSWRLFIQNYPEGIPFSAWLYNKDNIRGKPSFFYWLFAQRLGRLILGYFGSFFFMLGAITNSTKKEHWFFHVLGFSMVLYLFIFAGGNVQHDYYQIILVPIVVIYMGKGVDFLLSQKKKLFNQYMLYAVITVTTVFGLVFAWYKIQSFYWVNSPIIVTAGKKADELLPQDAKVIAPYGGDTAFLYQVNRQGWPQGFEIEDKMSKGASYYVSVTPNDAEVTYVKSKYTTIYEGDGFIIIKLQ